MSNPLPDTATDRWNANHPVGTPVFAWPACRDDAPMATRTRTPAWTLGHGEAVVSVEGYTGGIRLAHIEPRDADDQPTGQLYPCGITVYCDDCDTEVRGDYIVSDLMTSAERLAVARTWLVEARGWECGEGGDFCPTHTTAATS